MKSIQRCKASVEIRNLSVVYNHNLNCFWEWSIVNYKTNFVTWKSYTLTVEKDFFSSSEKHGTEKILSPHKESNLRPLDFALWCSTTEPQRLHGEGGLLRSSYDTQIVFRNEYYLAYFLLILNSKRSISVRMKRKISLLDNFETSRLNSTRYFSQSETTYVMLWMYGWAYVGIFTAVAP